MDSDRFFQGQADSDHELGLSTCPLVSLLPSELLDQILSYLSAEDLTAVSATCHTLKDHAFDDRLWASIVNSQLPIKLDDPAPFESFRTLYAVHYPFWFIPRNKIWFSDTAHTGNLIMTRYDHRRGIIDAFRVLAERQSNAQLQFWEYNPEVIIQTFHPRVFLWFDDPVMCLVPRSSNLPAGAGPLQHLHGEIRMPMALESQSVFNAFSLCSNKDSSISADTLAENQWPPLKIPASKRVYRNPDSHWSGWDERPRRLAEISDSAFRIRKWAYFRMGLPVFEGDNNEAISTYATLDPSLYTPTKSRPYQGIWVGDYGAHGCEFLLVLQRDREPAESATEYGHSTAGASVSSSPSGVSRDYAGFETGDYGTVIPKGSLEAIKLTGDPNVPRGEISFIADDIGDDGLVRVADEDPFRGARIVASKGHLAGVGFRDDIFIDSQLILVSPDCLAHYWVAMGHVSYYRRVDIDALIGESLSSSPGS